MNASKPHALVVRLGAELCIIVLGVLIALWANEWWADRADKLEASEILGAIREDVAASQELVREDLDDQEKVLGYMLTVSGGSEGASSSLSGSEMREAMFSALWETPQFRLQMSAFEEIKSSGRLGLLKDPELRRALAEFDAMVGRVRAMYDDQMQHQQTKLDAYAIDHVDMTEFSEYIFSDVEGAEFVPDSGEQVDLRSLLDDRVFKNLVTTKYFLMRTGHEVGKELHELLSELEEMLDGAISY